MPKSLVLSLTLLLFSSSCAVPDPKEAGARVGEGLEVDGDNDGFPSSEDCNDGDSAVNGGAVEVCDGIDNDCDGAVDEEVGETYYADLDGDGFGDPGAATEACSPPDGAVANGDDCDDARAEAYPNAPEQCDGLDEDCDGVIDEDVVSVWFPDEDGDGVGDSAGRLEDCDPPDGFVVVEGDCDDSRDGVYPGAPEVCDELDNDCDTLVDEDVTATFYADLDGDGFGVFGETVEACSQPEGYSVDPGDCADLDENVNPDAPELCNGGDDNCDGWIDEDSAVDAVPWWADADVDGFGDAGVEVVACAAPTGFVGDDQDCVDSDPAIHPDATEICNGWDDDCDALIDDGDADLNRSTGLTFFADADRDGHGDGGAPVEACVLPSGYTTLADDCDDTNSRIHPGVSEVCNGYDDDCDGASDDADPGLDTSTGGTFYVDADTDGFGDLASPVRACLVPAGSVANATDCDDAAIAVHPGATEVCNGIDDDCDAAADDADMGLDLSTGDTFYRDGDLDGYGAAGFSVRACVQPSGYVVDATDCDDGARLVSPGATEICNLTDDDCDGAVDDADPTLDRSTGGTYYTDGDGDGYGALSGLVRACVQPSGTVTDSTDCDDGALAVHPGASEVCNGWDDDCDFAVDDADSSWDSSSGNLYFPDSDRDGYGAPSGSQRACSAPTGFVLSSTDCDDGALAVNPGATETCNSVDDDCDGSVDAADSSLSGGLTVYRDADGDGYGTGSATSACSVASGWSLTSGDCDDATVARSPVAAETCNSIDDDCDGLVDDSDPGRIGGSTWYRDVDGDTWGGSSTRTACTRPSGYVGSGGDCNDGVGSTYPGAYEACDSVDNDCDGSTDEGWTSGCASLTCTGTGLIHTIPDGCINDGGGSAGGDALQVYCINGIARFCLSGESCQFRSGSTSVSASVTCDRSGLGSDYMANAWCTQWNGHANYYCDSSSRVYFP